jgi:hypothetical protein
VPYAVDAAFLRKLGLKAGARVALIEAPSAFADAFTALVPAQQSHLQDWALRQAQGDQPEHFDTAVAWVQDAWDLEAAFRTLQRMVQPDGAVWAVIPKKKHQGNGYPDVDFARVQAAGLTTDLVDNKDLTFSEAEYGIRFVVRKDRRARLP